MVFFLVFLRKFVFNGLVDGRAEGADKGPGGQDKWSQPSSLFRNPSALVHMYMRMFFYLSLVFKIGFLVNLHSLIYFYIFLFSLSLFHRKIAANQARCQNSATTSIARWSHANRKLLRAAACIFDFLSTWSHFLISYLLFSHDCFYNVFMLIYWSIYFLILSDLVYFLFKNFDIAFLSFVLVFVCYLSIIDIFPPLYYSSFFCLVLLMAWQYLIYFFLCTFRCYSVLSCLLLVVRCWVCGSAAHFFFTGFK